MFNNPRKPVILNCPYTVRFSPDAALITSEGDLRAVFLHASDRYIKAGLKIRGRGGKSNA